MDTSLLPPLVLLLEEQSVSLAAKRAGITQPAMSRVLARLRKQLGDELLVKAGRGVVRTARGEQLLPAARAALQQAQAVLAPPAAFAAKTATGTVTLALGDDMQAIAAAAILVELRKRAPGLDVRLKTLSWQTVVDARRGDIDLAVMPKLSPKEMPDISDFVVKPLYERRFVTVGKQEKKKKQSLDSFCSCDHVLVSYGGDDRGYVDEALAKLGRRRRVAMTVQGFGTALQVLARHGDLLATLPLDVVEALAPRSLSWWPCPVETPRFPMCLAWVSRHTGDARHQFLRDVVTKAVVEAAA